MRFVLFALLLAGCTETLAQERVDMEPSVIKSIYWSDGDSGRLIYADGRKIKFRLANIDAPETGGIGSIGGAKCERERELGFKAKEFMVELMKNVKNPKVAYSNGLDKYDRLVIDISVDYPNTAAGAEYKYSRTNVSELGVLYGHLKEWPHKGRRQLAKKPDWCRE